MSIPFVQQPPPFPYFGEIASLTAAVIWAGSISAFRAFGDTVPPDSLNLFKTGIAFICMCLTALFIPDVFPRDVSVWVILGISGVIGLAVGDTVLFASLRRLGAQPTSVLQCLAPPMAAGIAALFLNESLTRAELRGMLVTIVAVSGVVYFGRHGESHLCRLPVGMVVAGVGYGIAAALAQAIGIVTARQALQSAHALHGSMIRIFPGILVLVGMGLVRGNLRAIPKIFHEPRRAVVLITASVGGAFIGIWLLSVGVKYAKAGVASALVSTFPVWVIPIARFILKERVSMMSALCTVVAVCGVAMMLMAAAVSAD